MKSLRILLPSLALAALTASGCFLLSGQLIVSVALPTLNAVNAGAAVGKYIDLSTENSDYKDNKDKIKAIPDVAVLGTFKNNIATAVSGEVWLVPNPVSPTLLADKTAVIAAGGIKVWSLSLAASETKTVDWNKSAGLFTAAGKAALIKEFRGDGTFALYVFGSTPTYDVTVTKGVLVAVISVGV